MNIEKFEEHLRKTLCNKTAEELLVIYKDKINRPRVMYRIGNKNKHKTPFGDPRRSLKGRRKMSKQYYEWAINKLTDKSK